MSLQVWLPLTSDLHNQGLSDYSISMFRGTETYNANGKLGKCFYANGVNTIKILNIIPDFYNYTAYSISAWFYIEARNTSHSGSAIISAGNWNSQVINLAVSDWSSDHYTLLRISGTSWGKTYSYNFNLNTWYHVVVSCDGSKTYAYVNGVLIGDTQPSFLPSSIEGNDIAIGGATYYSGMQFFGRINDVRIYNHCLSQKEIKEISKGLVAHYTLGDSYLEGTTNLCNTLSNSCYNGATKKYGYGTTTDIYKDSGTFQGRNCVKIRMGTAGLSAYPYVFFDSIHPAQNAYKTLSFWYYPTIQTSIVFYTYNGNATATYTVNGGAVTSGSTIPVILNKWNYITLTLLGTSDKTSGWGYMRIGTASHTSTTTDYWLISNIQVEEKDHATGYTDTTRNETTVYDSSGYNYHMTAYSSPTISTNTIRNAVSTHFTNGQYLMAQYNSTSYLPTDAITVNLWMYCTTWGNPISCTEGGGFNFENSNGLRFQLYVNNVGYKPADSGVAINSLLNTWHMLTGTFDKTSVKIYIDGELKATTETGSTTNGIKYVANRLVIAAEAQTTTPASSTFVGEISDVRIYATPLSEEDIKALYNTPVSISNTGAMFTQGEFVEV